MSLACRGREGSHDMLQVLVLCISLSRNRCTLSGDMHYLQRPGALNPPRVALRKSIPILVCGKSVEPQDNRQYACVLQIVDELEKRICGEEHQTVRECAI